MDRLDITVNFRKQRQKFPFFVSSKLIMSQFHLTHIPPVPTIPEEPALKGITTRVMAIKQKDNELRRSKGSLSGRRNSRFLSGTSIPNSTIRGSLENPDQIDLPVPKIPSTHLSNLSKNSSEDASKDPSESQNRGLERMRQKIRRFSQNTEAPVVKKERRRSSTVKDLDSDSTPQNQMRRPTLESIKNAIDKSPNHVMKLVNADSIEKSNVGQHFRVSVDQVPIPRPKPEKRDLQTQTSLVLEKVLLQMRPKA